MRSIWRGAITFGLVNVPVKLYAPPRTTTCRCTRCTTPTAGASATSAAARSAGEIVDYEHIDKAYDDGDRTVMLTDDDLKALPSAASREIDVVEFVPSEQVDPIRLDKSYFLEPDSKCPRSYMLLRRMLEEADRIAIVQFTLRQKTRLGALRVHGDVLLLQSLLWDDEVRAADFPSLKTDVRIQQRELEMAESLVRSFESRLLARQVHRRVPGAAEAAGRREARARASRSTPRRPSASSRDEGDGDVIDLMEALRRSVAANREASDKRKRTPAKRGA